MSAKSLAVVIDVPVVDEHGDNGGEIFVKFCIVVCGTPASTAREKSKFVFLNRRSKCRRFFRNLPFTMPIKSVRRWSFGLPFSLLSLFVGICSATSADNFSSTVDCGGGWSNADFAFFGDSFAWGGDEAGFLIDVVWSLLFGWSERCKMNCTSLEYSPHFIRICKNCKPIKMMISIPQIANEH